ncbi:PP-loop domain protein, partial [mine drainage metagenome]
AMKRMIDAWRRESPGRMASIATALQQVSPSHLLDRTLWDFAGLAVRKAPGVEEGPQAQTDEKLFEREMESI